MNCFQTMKAFGALNLKCDAFINSTPALKYRGDELQESKEVDHFKEREFSRSYRKDLHLKSQRLKGLMSHAQVQIMSHSLLLNIETVCI